MRLRERIWVRVLIVFVMLGLPLGHLGAPVGAQDDADGIVNLAHLDFLHDTAPYLGEEGHEATEPGEPLDAWWTYADFRSETGIYERVGGGAYDPEANTWGQGAYNLDDVARAAVVYLNHYRYWGDDHSLMMGRGALRFVLYMQTLTGENTGNFVLWMQPDGTLTPEPEPPDSPNPADADFSWWAARAMWALAEGYQVFEALEPDFAAVLAERMTLAMEALKAQVIDPNYPDYDILHGFRVPSWFISDGADASSIAVIGLTRFYEATGDPLAEELMTKLAEGIANYQVGDPDEWAFEALLPWAGSVSNWHAWGVRMGMALSLAGEALDQSAWIDAAEREANSFITHEWVSIGPINGLLPSPSDLVQINYGNEVLTNNLLALAEATEKETYSHLAGLQATWWFGNNPAGEPMYDPETGRGYDGIEPDGRINRNSGAESTISALLGLMNVLQNPIAADYLAYDEIVEIVGWEKFEAEAGVLSEGAEVITPESAWTGEALWSGGAYVELEAGEEVTIPITLPVSGAYLLQVVFDKQPGPRGGVLIGASLDDGILIPQAQGGAGAQGVSPNPSYLWMEPIWLVGSTTAGEHELTLRGLNGTARIDCVLPQPVHEYRTLQNDEGGTVTLVRSFARFHSVARVPVASDEVSAMIVGRHGQTIYEDGVPVRNDNAWVALPGYGWAVLKTE